MFIFFGWKSASKRILSSEISGFSRFPEKQEVTLIEEEKLDSRRQRNEQYGCCDSDFYIYSCLNKILRRCQAKNNNNVFAKITIKNVQAQTAD